MTARADWTFAQAQAAQAEFQANGGTSSDPAGPFWQWAALHQLEGLRLRFESGESYALMQALRKCANHNLLLPAWVSNAYIHAFDTVHNYRAKSWDEVFGKPLEKSAQLASLRKRHEKSVHVWNEVRRLSKEGQPIDDMLFARVGRKFDLGVTLTKEYYAEWATRMSEPMSPIVKALLAPFIVKPDGDGK